MPKLKVKKIEYYQDQGDFLQKLKEFHDARGTPLGRLPTFGGQSLDLYALYNTVTSLGGISVVTDRKKWDDVFKLLGFPPCTNAAYALRQHYARYLESYEKIFFFGEDDENADQSLMMSQRLRYRRINKPPKWGQLGEPLVHNFDRLSFSLQSGLSNEVNFALNICALLSNVTNSIFNLAKSRNILDLILAHVGVWPENGSSMKELYDEWYSDKDTCFIQFWLKNLEGNLPKIMYQASYDEDSFEKPTVSSLFATPLQSKDVQLCRANQVALILYNFSFEQINAMYMGSHEATKKFLLMSCCSTVSSLCKSGFETLDNICQYVELPGVESKISQFILYVLDKSISSNDKFKRSRAISMLGKLSLNESNSHVLSSSLTLDYYERLIQMLHLPDVVLILSSLDALYSLSNLSESTATGIAMVHGGIEVLISLLTIRAESFGNGAIKGYRIIENKHSIFTQKNQELLRQRQQQIQQQQQAALRQRTISDFPPPPHHHFPPRPFPPGMNRAPAPPLPIPTHMGISRPPLPPRMPAMIPPREPIPQPPPQQTPPPNHMTKPTEELVEIDSEIFAAHWLSANYEPVPDGRLSVQDIYKIFHQACNEFQRKAILPEPEFFELLKSILPPHISRVEGETPETFTMSVGKRKNAIPIQSNIPKSMHENLLKHKSSLLKRTNPVRNVSSGLVTPTTPSLGDTRKSDVKNTTSEVDGSSQLTLADFQNDPQYKHILENKDLNSLQVCQDLAEKLKADSQFHFTQFHVHRQQFQTMQFQMQQLIPQIQSQQSNGGEQPAELIKSLTMRTQMHHQVMQIHYSQLESLSKLLMHIQRKLSMNNIPDKPITPANSSEKNPSLNPLQKPHFPFPGMPNGMFPDAFIPPSPFPNSTPKTNGKTSRGKGSRSKATRGIATPKRPRGSARGASRSKSRLSEVMQQLHPGNMEPSNPQVPLPPYEIPSSFTPRQPNLQNYPLRAPSLASSKFTHSPCSSFLPPGKANDVPLSPNATIDLNDTNLSVRSQILGQISEKTHNQNPTKELSRMENKIEPVRTLITESNGLPSNNGPTSPMSLGIVTASLHVTSSGSSSLSSATPPTSTGVIDINGPITSVQSEDAGKSADNSIVNHKTLLGIASNNESHKANPSSLSLQSSSPCSVSQSEPISSRTEISSNPNDSTTSSEEKLSAIYDEKQSESITRTDMSVDTSATDNMKIISSKTSPMSSPTNRKSYDIDPTNDDTQKQVLDIRNSNNETRETMFGNDTVKQKDHNICENGVLSTENKTLHKLQNGNIERVSCESPQMNGNISDHEPMQKVVPNNSKASKVTSGGTQIDYSQCNGHLNGHIDEDDVDITQNKLLNKGVGITVCRKMDEGVNITTSQLLNEGEGGDITRNKLLNKGIAASEQIDESVDVTASRLLNEGEDGVMPNKLLNEDVDIKSDNLRKKGVDVAPNKLCNGIADHELHDNQPKEIKAKNLSLEFTENVPGNNLSNDKLDDILDMPFSDISDNNPSKVMSLHIDNPNTQKVVSSIQSPLHRKSVDMSEPAMYNLDSVTSNSSQLNLPSREKRKRNQSFHCCWKSCDLPDFKKASHLLAHMIMTHAPLEGRIGHCMVEGCRKVPLLRGAMIMHFQEEHCVTINDDNSREKVQLNDKLFANKMVPPPYVEDESPVTRSVRYTAALILRNIARRSPLGKSLISRYEHRISLVALSNSEAAVAASDCLSELLREETMDADEEKETIADDEDTLASETSDYVMLSEDDDDNFVGNYDDDLLTYTDSPETF